MKSRRRKILCITFAVLGLLSWFLHQLIGPHPAIIVSRETTYITSPLGPDGLPDYDAAFLSRTGNGVTPENNAAVLIWQATWPGNLEPDQYATFCDALGMKAIPSRDESLVSIYDESLLERIGTWLENRPERASEESVTARTVPLDTESLHDIELEGEWELIGRALNRPWTGRQIPPLAEWVSRNRMPLDLLVEASRRPMYFSPPPSLLVDSNKSLIVMMPHMPPVRDVARALTARAMWHVGEGRLAEAWEDLHALRRIARLICRGGTLFEQAVAIAIDSMACSATQVLLHHGRLDHDEAGRILQDLGALSSPSDTAKSLDEFERLIFADAMLGMASGRVDVQDFLNMTTDERRVIASASIDWNVVLREGNKSYDRLVAAARLPTRDERVDSLKRFNEELQTLGSTSITMLPFLLTIGREARSRAIANRMVNVFVPGLSTTIHAEDRATVVTELTRTAAALVVYRADHGQYPATLPHLVPDILPAVPIDLYSGHSLKYERRDKGYLLYSVDENRIDNGGTSGWIINGEWVATYEELDRSQTDLVVRQPLPDLPSDP